MNVTTEEIKWMCDKAGWEMIIYSNDDYEIIPGNRSEDEDFFTSIGHLMAHYAWGALLQRAIEGVNRTSNNLFITQGYSKIEVHHRSYIDSLLYDCCFICSKSIHTVDNAKLSALRYVMGQDQP